MAAPLADGASPAIALVPWGDVIEEFLSPLDLRLDDFVDRMSGGWLFGYVAALQSAGWRPFIVCASSEVATPTRFVHRSTGAPIWAVPGRRSALPYSSRRSAAQWWRTPWHGFAHVLRREHCAALLVQEYEYARFDALVLLAKCLRLPLFASFQGGDHSLSALEARLRPWSLRQARGLIVASSQERERLASVYPRVPPVAAIPNPIDTEEWCAAPRVESRAALGLSPGDFIAVTHGRIDIHRKGLDILVAAWRTFAARRTDCHLFVIGSGQDNEPFARLLASAKASSVTWQARYNTDRAEVRRWLSAADVYLSASRIEGMPVAPLEAMACGLPVIATRAQGLPDILVDGEASGGILVDREDAAGLAQALTRLKNDPELQGRLSGAAHARVQGQFSLSSVGHALITFMSSPNG